MTSGAATVIGAAIQETSVGGRVAAWAIVLLWLVVQEQVGRPAAFLTRQGGASAGDVLLMIDPPFARAAVASGRISLNPWHPGLIDGGPRAVALRPGGRRGVVLADLTEIGDGELLITFVPRDGATDQARQALLGWAAAVGWQRVWLDDRVASFTGEPALTGRAGVRCPTCGTRWEDERPEFWHHVREDGWFPPTCLACGGSLPQWEVDERRASDERSSARPRDHRAR
jgi:hypothetical protein